MQSSRIRLFVLLALVVGLVIPTALRVAPVQAEGPGFGNLTYTDAELFTAVARVDNSNGVPTDSPGKAYGVNVAMMHNGYFVTTFAPDSGGGPGGILFYDVSNPRNIRLVNRVYDSRTSEFRESHAFGTSNSYDGDMVVLQSGYGIEFWDFSDAMNPIQVSKLALPGVNFGDYSSVAWQLFWQAPYVYVAVANQGIYIVDASDPANPSIVNRGPGKSNPIPPSQLGGFSVGPIFAVGNLLVITGMETSNSIATLDISDPINPVVTSSGTSSPFYYASFFNGNRLIMSQRGANAKMHVYTLNSSSAPVLENNSLTIDEQLYNATQDNYVFQGAQGEIVKVDISNPSSYSIVGRGSLNVSNPDHGQVTPIGNLVFVGNDHGTGSGFIVHQKTPDYTPPEVNMVVPKNNATGQALTTRVGLTFTDNIDLHTVDSSTFIVRPLGGAPLSGKYSHQTSIVNFHPDSPLLPNTTYEVVVPAGGLKDWAGNTVGTTFTSRFSTGSSVSSLTVAAATSSPTEVGSTVSFNAAATGGSGIQYSWNFGDGTPATAFSSNPAITHTYSNPGHYQVTVTAKSGTQLAGDGFTQIIHRPLTSNKPTNSSTIVLDEPNNRVWVVNPDNDTVTAINASTYAKLFEQPVGDNPRTLAIAGDGKIWVANQGSATISILNQSDGSLDSTITLHPGSEPYGIAFNPAGNTAFVSLQGSGKVLKIDRATKNVTGETSLGFQVRGVAVSHDGSRVLVTRFISSDAYGEVIEVNPSTMAVVRSIPLAIDLTPDGEDRGRGLPNYLSSITISPDGSTAWVGSKKDNILRGEYRDSTPLTFDSTVRTIASQINLTTNTENATLRIDFNDRDMAQAVAFSPYGDLAFIALQGSNMVQVHNAYDSNRATILFDTGLAPQGLVLNSTGTRLFVHNFMSRTVKVYNTTSLVNVTSYSAYPLTDINTVATEALSNQVLRGKQIFYNARDHRMSLDGYISCASCHLDGDSDGRVWDFTDRGEGLRNTHSLQGRGGTDEGNVHWTGNFDEIQDFENDIRNSFGGAGFMTDAQFNAGTRSNPLGDTKAGVSYDLDALAAYVKSLNVVGQSPYRNADGSLTSDGVAGRLIFEQKSCYSCHAGSNFTDSRAGILHNVGTIKPSSGSRIGGPIPGFDTPSLSGLWKTAPYLHDGSAPTLLDVLTTQNPSGAHRNLSDLNSTQLNQLVSYLLQIDDNEEQNPPSTLYTAQLTNMQVVPSTSSTAKGQARVVVAEDGTSALVTLRLTGLSGAVTAAHIHGPAAPGANGPQLYSLPLGNFTDHSITFTISDTDALLAGQLYIDVHTAANPNGEIRGQIKDNSPSSVSTTYLSDMAWESSTNGWGPVERDQSNGEQLQGDGFTLTLNGVTYSKGLGVHANSTITYNLDGLCSSFQSDIGLDDSKPNGSVVFQVWTDGVKVYDSGVMVASTATKQIDVSVLGARKMQLVVTNGGDNIDHDHADWADARITCGGVQTTYLSDKDWVSASNGWGPVERDKSNGEQAANDGSTITINGATYSKGLGVHANSTIRYQLDGTCSTFMADVGVDDEVTATGSVVFQVWADSVKVYDSGLMNYSHAAKRVNASIGGASILELVVTDGGNGNGSDHADWADARIVCGDAVTATFLSDMSTVSEVNAWGPMERDRSNGEQGAADGLTITLNGITYGKGLGVHANSDIRYNLGGSCNTFYSDIGVDDEVGSNGSVVFQVWTDGVKVFDSGTMTGSSTTQQVSVGVTGVNELRLVVTDSGNGNGNDHADWANARVLCSY